MSYVPPHKRNRIERAKMSTGQKKKVEEVKNVFAEPRQKKTEVEEVKEESVVTQMKVSGRILAKYQRDVTTDKMG